MSETTKKTSGGFPLVVSAAAILICILIGIFIYKGILGADSNFEGGDPDKGHPHNILGTMYKGGFIVPILIGFLLTVITFAIEHQFFGNNSHVSHVVNVLFYSAGSFMLGLLLQQIFSKQHRAIPFFIAL